MNPYSFKEKYTQKIVCRQCGKILGERIKNKTGNILEFSGEITCNDCKKKNQLNAKIRMVLNNPQPSKNQIESDNKFVKEYLSEKENLNLKEKLLLLLLNCLDFKKEQELQEKIKQNCLETSERMKTNNPMFNKDVVEKVVKTQKKIKRRRKT